MTLTSSNRADLAAAPVTPAPPRRGIRTARLVGFKVLSAALVLLGAATAAFFAQASIPGDRATVILNVRAGQAIERTPEELAPIIAEYGLDNPLLVQYADYVLGLARGDLGTSYQQHRPVIDIVADQLGATIVLTLTALVLAWVIMVAWVTLTAGRGPRVRAFGAFTDTLAAGLPHYWLGIILLIVFALATRLVPGHRRNRTDRARAAGADVGDPAGRVPRSGDAHRVRARARRSRSCSAPAPAAWATSASGCGHVLRHAVLPAVTLSGWALGATISGAVVVEAVFARPGIGRCWSARSTRRTCPS